MTEIKVLEWEWLQKIRFVFARRLYRPGFQRRPCSDLEKKGLDGKKEVACLLRKVKSFCLFDFVQKSKKSLAH